MPRNRDAAHSLGAAPAWLKELPDEELQKKIIEWHAQTIATALAEVEARHKEEKAKAKAVHEAQIAEIKQLHKHRNDVMRQDLQKALHLSLHLDLRDARGNKVKRQTENRLTGVKNAGTTEPPLLFTRWASG